MKLSRNVIPNHGSPVHLLLEEPTKELLDNEMKKLYV